MNPRHLTCGLVIYDEITLIQRGLNILKYELQNFSVSWIFVLNHPEMEIRSSLKSWIQTLELPRVVVLENPTNNLGHARQLILQSATTDWLYITDPDVLPAPGSLSILTETAFTLESTSNVVGLGGPIQHVSTHPYISVTYEFMENLIQHLPFSFQIQTHLNTKQVDHMPACHLLLNVKKSIQVGGFSDYFNKCGEDTAFSQACFNLNRTFLFIPESKVVHHHNISFSKWLMKIFNFGRAQINVLSYFYHNPTVEKMRLRWYRLSPLIIFIFFVFCVIANPVVLFFGLSIFCLGAWIKPGLFGFVLVVATYALGEIAEIICLILKLQSATESRVSVNKNQIRASDT